MVKRRSICLLIIVLTILVGCATPNGGDQAPPPKGNGDGQIIEIDNGKGKSSPTPTKIKIAGWNVLNLNNTKPVDKLAEVIKDLTRSHLKNAKWPDLCVRLES